ncbi:hypothetical protein CERZMDRAFT_82804 [Cercospora zeae-maydis SCOH1-5]|uniref:Uncharacterized protein n=1 Tax=Cercospora zeae-maydis SCOH1-5 TaxID=717836 RepID=A0A6A6FND5_9PEZI|nr:hypothetical protein CERZMDRAFT_82804 [Cercospora zeae-maydis SCOH1-5]
MDTTAFEAPSHDRDKRLTLPDLVLRVDNDLTEPVSATLTAVHLTAYFGLVITASCVLVVAYCFTLTWLALLWLQTHLLLLQARLLRLTIGKPLTAQYLRRAEEDQNEEVGIAESLTEPSTTEKGLQPLAENFVPEQATKPLNHKAGPGNTAEQTPVDQPATKATTVAPVLPSRANPLRVNAANLHEARGFARSIKQGSKRDRDLYQRSLAARSNDVEQPTYTTVPVAPTPSPLNDVPNGSCSSADFVPPHKRKTMEAEARRAAAAATKTAGDNDDSEHTGTLSAPHMGGGNDSLDAENSPDATKEESGDASAEPSILPATLAGNDPVEQLEAGDGGTATMSGQISPMEEVVQAVRRHLYADALSYNADSWQPKASEGLLIDIDPSIAKFEDTAQSGPKAFRSLFGIESGSRTHPSDDSTPRARSPSLDELFGPKLDVKAMSDEDGHHWGLPSSSASTSVDRAPPGLGPALRHRQDSFAALLRGPTAGFKQSQDGNDDESPITEIWSPQSGSAASPTEPSTDGHDTATEAQSDDVFPSSSSNDGSGNLLDLSSDLSSIIQDDPSFNEAEPDKSQALPVQPIAPSSDGNNEQANEEREAICDDPAELSKKATRKARQEARLLLKRKWVERDVIRSRLASTRSLDDVQQLTAATAAYMAQRDVLASHMHSGTLNALDAEWFPHFTPIGLLRPRVTPDGVQQMREDVKREMAATAAEEARLNPPPPPPTPIEKATESLRGALDLRSHALAYRVTPDRGLTPAKWKETADKKLDRATNYYNVKRQNLLNLYTDAALRAEAEQKYPQL